MCTAQPHGKSPLLAQPDAPWLGAEPGVQIDSIEVQPIAAGEGLMGRLAGVGICAVDDHDAGHALGDR